MGWAEGRGLLEGWAWGKNAMLPEGGHCVRGVEEAVHGVGRGGLGGAEAGASSQGACRETLLARTGSEAVLGTGSFRL